VNLRPDIAIKTSSKVILLELTVCHETNFQSSRNYKLNKYQNIENNRSEFIKHLPVIVYTCEISTLGFVVLDPLFISLCSLPDVDRALLSGLAISAINSSFEIYNDRNT